MDCENADESALGRTRCYTDDTGTIRSSATVSPSSSVFSECSSNVGAPGRDQALSVASAPDRTVRSLLYAEAELCDPELNAPLDYEPGVETLETPPFEQEVRALLDSMIEQAAAAVAVEDTAAAVTVAVEGTAAAVTVAVEDTAAAAAVTVAVEDTAAATVAVAVEDTGGEQEIERTVPEVAVDPSRECSGIAASEAVLKPMPVPEVFQRVQHRYHKITVPLSGCVATVPIGAEPPRVGASGIAQLSPSPKRCATPPLHAQPISQAHLRPYGRHLRLSPSARIPTPRVGQIGAENGGGIPVPLD